MILKYSSKFGTSDDVLAVIERAVHRNLDEKANINPQLFDDIEHEIVETLKGYGDTSPISFKSSLYTPKLRALKGIKQPSVPQI